MVAPKFDSPGSQYKQFIQNPYGFWPCNIALNFLEVNSKLKRYALRRFKFWQVDCIEKCRTIFSQLWLNAGAIYVLMPIWRL